MSVVWTCQSVSRGGESSRLTDNPPPGFGGPPDPFTSPSKPDSTGSGVTEEGEIAAVLSRMLDQAGRMDAQAVAQVRLNQTPNCNTLTAATPNLGWSHVCASFLSGL